MKIEEYFDFLEQDDIRIKGTRIGIESVLYEYIYREKPPEEIKKQFSELTLEQVYASILYYLQHRKEMDKYLNEWLRFSRKARARQKINPPPVVIKLKDAKKKNHQKVNS